MLQRAWNQRLELQQQMMYQRLELQQQTMNQKQRLQQGMEPVVELGKLSAESLVSFLYACCSFSNIFLLSAESSLRPEGGGADITQVV